MAESQVRQNYHRECEDGVNRQINLELYAMYTYLSMVSSSLYVNLSYQPPQFSFWLFLRVLCWIIFHSHSTLKSYYFERDDVALKGFAKYFRKASKEELEHAEKLMKFQNDRGGRIILQDIKRPAKDEWGTGLDTMQAAMELEKTVNQALLDLHKVADKHSDFMVSCLHHRIYFGCIVPTGSGLASSCLWYSPGNGFSECAFWHHTISRNPNPALGE